MAKQRQLLNARLGLDVVSKIGIDVSGLFTTEDLTVPAADAHEIQAKVEDNRKPLRDLISSASEASGLSSREKNRAKRKARQAYSKQKSREPTEEEYEPDKKKNKMDERQRDETALTIG